ncbi:MAG: ABC transporter permease [Lachnospiraceae bacterium]|nr:ABC transporter permease [Lachnospiraceae bacterium]
MKNPLRKRYIRELKSDFGKYLAIALFMIMLIGLVSGYLVAAGSIEKTFYEGWDKYNVEDGHITFSLEPTAEVMSKIGKEAGATFYDLQYAEEDIDDKGTTLRIFRVGDRNKIDGVCLMEGNMPKADNEIVIDRIFANNNSLSIGDTVTLAGKHITVTGYVALVDYNCLFENNNDMMFNANIFGVAVMTDEGYEALKSDHIFWNYAWKYNEAPVDEKEENARFEDFIDVIEEMIKEYDTGIVQAEVNSIYDRANILSAELENEFENASSVLENKISDATDEVVADLLKLLTDEEKITLYMQGASDNEYFAYALAKQNKKMDELIADKLGTSAETLKAFTDAAENLKDEIDSMSLSGEAPVISLDEDAKYDNEMDMNLNPLRDVISKLDATGLADVTKLTGIIDELEELSEYEFDENKLLQVDNLLPKYQNKSVTYCMDDMSSDKPMFIVFDYIVVVILAFVFAVNASSTIQKEAGVIGTLRASGYTKAEMVRHFLFMPLLISVIAAIIGNVLGYTVFVNMMKGVFYNSFSLATYESIFNCEAFIITTVIPLILMAVINLYMIISKLKLSPIKFLRRDLSKKKKRRAVLLNKKIAFISRFRLRILFQNVSAYAVMIFGIFCGSVIAVFGFMFGPLLSDYADLIVEEKICDYQYVLMEQNETECEGVEKYCITSLEMEMEGFLKDDVSIYGIEDNSAYITKEIPTGEVLISEGVAKKYKLKNGDRITLKNPYNDKEYEFIVGGTYAYSAALTVFMNIDEYRQTFGEKEDYFTGYFSNRKITDIDSKDIAAVITESDLTKVSDQMLNSMGEFMSLFKFFGAIMLALLMYLMTKQIIEKNTQSIAMTKILGFRNGEIAGLYLVMTGIVVIASLLLTMPLTDGILRFIFENYLYKEVSGYLPFIVSNNCYIYTFAIGIACFAIVAAFMIFKIGRIEKSEALKNVE